MLFPYVILTEPGDVFSHFMNGETEAFRDETACLRPHSSEQGDLGPKAMRSEFEFRAFVLFPLREDYP